MNLNLLLEMIRKHTYEILVLILCALMLIVLTVVTSKAQGLANNGATINISSMAYVTVAGGNGSGNLTNQDFGASTGNIENNGFIYVTGDWINNSALRVFNSNSGTVVLSGTYQNISGSTPTYFNNLQLEGSSSKVMQVDVTVGGGFAGPNGTLSLGNAELQLNAHTLTVTNPFTNAITRLNGFIVSETASAFNPSIVHWNCGGNTGYYLFPFGSSNGYTPVGIDKSSAINSDLYVSTRATKFDDNQPWATGVAHLNSPVIGGPGEVAVVIDRWYAIGATNPLSVNIDLTYSGLENTTTFAPNGIFGMQNWNGSNWLPPAGSGPGVVAGTATVSATGINIGPLNNNWVLANILAPLPVDLISYQARCDYPNINIEWVVANEQNISNYKIERSIDAKNFQTVALVTPQLNNTNNKYLWTDLHPGNGINYYRLIETDWNGESTIFNTLSVKPCSIGTNGEPQIYSNGSIIYFNLDQSASETIAVTLFDASGKQVLQEIKKLHDEQQFNIKTTLPEGIYFVRYSNQNSTYTQKVSLWQ